jgi:DNA-binding Lrp family transcriptional regulator
MIDIDPFDLKILNLLQANGRLTNQELSELIGLSPSQCSRRRINLEQSQMILGYHARLSPQAMRLDMVAMIEVKLVSHDAESAAWFQQFIASDSAIIDAYKTTGEADYALKIAVSDLVSLNALLSRIFVNKIVAHIKTSVVLERLKDNGIPTA